MTGQVVGAQHERPRRSTTAEAGAPAALELNQITKTFGTFTALDAAELRVEAGSVHCLLGENGAGKSTLCNVVFGVHHADSGRIRVADQDFAPRSPADALSRGVAMVHQHFSLVPTLSAVDNLLLGPVRWRLPRTETRRRIRDLSERYGMTFDPDVKVSQLSVGERQRVEIVKCLSREPHLLVLDEPTAVLPPTEVDGLLDLCRRVADDGHAVLLVTHKLAEVAQVGDRATVLHHGRTVGTVPLPETPSSRLVEMMIGGDVETIDSSVAAAIGLATGTSTRSRTSGSRPARTDNAPAFELDGILVQEGERRRLSDVSLSVRPGEIVGIAGVEGNGQTELARVAAGFLQADQGTVRLDGVDVGHRSASHRARHGLAVIPEDRHAEAIVPGMSLATNLALGDLRAYRRFGIVRRKALRAHAADLMERFDIRAAGSETDISDLSGGNQQKVVLARELTRDPLIAIIAAQPTRGLDVGAVQAVLQRLRDAAEQGAAVMVISSELSELMTLCDRLTVIYGGSLVGEVRPDDPDALAEVGSLMTGAQT